MEVTDNLKLNKVLNLPLLMLPTNTSVVPPFPTVVSKLDSGATDNYIRREDAHILQQRQRSQGPSVQLPDDSFIQSNEKGELPLPFLSKKAKTAHVFDDLKSASLIAVGQLCNDGYKVTFEDDTVIATKGNNLVLEGQRNHTNGLWDVVLSTNNHNNTTPILRKHVSNIIIRKSTTIKDLIHYFQGCCFGPSKSTFLKAVKNGNFITWPGLTYKNLDKNYTPTIFTAKGHLNQERKNLQSTKVIHTIPLSVEDEIAEHNDYFPSDEILQQPTNECMALMLPFESRYTGYSDLTGRFPYVSSQGNQYVLVMYDYDSNAILAEPVKNRQAAVLTKAFLTLYNTLATCGAKPKCYIMDNKCLGQLKAALKKNTLDFQLAPPHQHRRNAAERAIQTFKNHFLAGLAATDPHFPMSEWDRLIPQAVVTLNLLRNARLNPRLSSYAFLFGNFDFNKTPLAPPGTKILIHEKPDQRKSWDTHGLEGWYIGPALEHYRCVTAYIPETFSERVCDTVEFFPHSIPLPATSDADYLKQAAADILAILAKPKPTLPYIQRNDDLTNAITKTAQLLQRAVEQPKALQQQSMDDTSMPKKVPLLKPSENEPISPSMKLYGSPRVKEKPNPVHIIQHSTTIKKPGTNFKALSLNALIATEIFLPRMNHIYNEHGKRESTDSLLNGKDKEIWNRAVSNEIGRLAKGNDFGVEFTETIEFICESQVPAGRDVTYASFVFDERPLKKEKYRCRICAGGDRLPYLDDASSPATSLLETKLIVNSVISDAKQGARFMSLDLKDFFLASPMARPEYMRIALKHLPEDIIVRYKLREIATPDGFVYIQINKGMYGLKSPSGMLKVCYG